MGALHRTHDVRARARMHTHEGNTPESSHPPITGREGPDFRDGAGGGRRGGSSQTREDGRKGGTMDAKRVMTVDAAVRWAYREELPKARADGGWIVQEVSMLARMASPGEAVDDAAALWCLPDNRFGVVVFPSADDEPHADAVRIHDAVRALDDEAVEFDRDWLPGELAGLGDAAAAAVERAFDLLTLLDATGGRVMRITPAEIVRTAAILAPPDGTMDTPVLRTVQEFGKDKWFRRVFIATETGGFEAEVDGYNKTRQRPHPDAYRKWVLDPDPVDALVARARYQVWRSAMDVLHAELVDVLEHIALTPCEAAWAPWAQHGGPARVLADLTRPANRRKPAKRRTVKSAKTSCVRQPLGG